MDSSDDSIGIDVPVSLLLKAREEPIVGNDTLVAVDLAKSVFQLAVSDRPGRVAYRNEQIEAVPIKSVTQQVLD